jgi:hypothetical protein
MDSAGEQEKLEARKLPEMAAESPASSAPKKMAGHHFIREKREPNGASILRSGKHASRTKQWRVARTRANSRSAPWFPDKLI